MSAGLHLGSFAMIGDHPRFRDAKLGVIVSSLRALQLFLKKSGRSNRLPDYVVVEGPLAGGHLGFKIDNWREFDLAEITNEIIDFIKEQNLPIAVIPAGGIFTGADATGFVKTGSAAVQVATRFTVTKESGFPLTTQQRFFRALEEEIEVNLFSPTGYPMRMLVDSPCKHTNIRPNCETLGFILDEKGKCSYIDEYNKMVELHPEGFDRVPNKTCLCTFMRSYGTWTCGHMTYRLKETTNQLADGSYQQLTTAQVFEDYLKGGGLNSVLGSRCWIVQPKSSRRSPSPN